MAFTSAEQGSNEFSAWARRKAGKRAIEIPPNPLPEFAKECTVRFRQFFDALPGNAERPVFVLCHSDGDGLGAGVVIAAALRVNGRQVQRHVTGKFENPWTPELQARIAAADPVALIVCDLGVRPEPIVPGVPVCFIDHHHYSSAPEGALVISGLREEPQPVSGLIAWWCGQGLPTVLPGELELLPAISLLSDIGDKAPFPELARARGMFSLKTLREATSLLNALRRSATGDANAGFDLLLKVARGDGLTLKSLVAEDSPASAELHRARAEIQTELAQARRVAPKFAGNVAIIRINSPCQIHPLIAQQWRTRLPKEVVIGANVGYRPGWVHFSARTGHGIDLIRFFEEHRPDGAGENYGRGHAQASGGSLPVPIWNRWVRSLGFGPEMEVAELA